MMVMLQVLIKQVILRNLDKFLRPNGPNPNLRNGENPTDKIGRPITIIGFLSCNVKHMAVAR